MGLDCTAHEKVTLVEAISFGEMKTRKWRHRLYDEPGFLYLFNMECFRERGDGLVEGFYEYSGESLDCFSAGYSGYGNYRGRLARLAGTSLDAVWSDPKPGPFVEQLNFADNEGFLGPRTCAKLAADYETHAAKAKRAMGDWAEAYTEWMAGLRLAAGGGVVEFH